MLLLPSITSIAGHRAYADDAGPALRYLDREEPGAEARWMFASPGQALLAGELRLGPGSLPEAEAGVRHLGVPWGQAPVYVWARAGDGAAGLARGRSSGYGAHAAVFGAQAPAGLVAAPLRAAAELTCPARLGHGRVRVSGTPAALAAALRATATGPRADWYATLADALVAALEAALARGDLTLAVEAAAGAAELRALALLELASRAAAACGLESLAAPAALAGALAPAPAPEPQLDWREGERVTLRAVRSLQLRPDL